MTSQSAREIIAAHVIDVPDFPQPGVVFKDLSPLFADGPAFRACVDELVSHDGGFDVIAGIEARGFLMAAAAAYATGVGVVPIRKAGKLPRATVSATYALEYGSATLELHQDAFLAGQRVLLVDDVLATGGTAAAALDLVQQAGGIPVGFTALLELAFLNGRAQLGDHRVRALLTV